MLWLLYQKLYNSQLSFNNLNNFNFSRVKWVFILSTVLLLSTLNWILESIKWKLLVNSFSYISFSEAVKQSLMAHTAALITPFKAGEYSIKPMFYKKENTSKVVYLSFLTNASQLLCTLIFGILGLMYFGQQFIIKALVVIKEHIHYLCLLVIFLLVLSYVLWTLISKFKLRYLVNRKTHLENIGLAMLRYLVFSHQWVLLLMVLKPESNYWQVLSAVFSMYLIASIIPVFAAFDWAVKGSVAVLLFSLLGFDATLIIAGTLLLWIGNFLFPALVGVYFMFSFNPFKTEIYG